MKKHTHPSKEVVTINTDASYCPKTNTGGWGAQSPPRNNKGFTSWDTEWETNLIVDFLKTNRSIIRLWNIEKLAELPENSLDDLLRNNYKSIKQEKIDKLLPVLEMIGFKLKPRPDHDLFYEPVEKFEFNLNPKLSSEPDPKLDIEKIKKVVCSYFNIPVDMLHSKTQKREIVQARQIAMFFSKSLTKSSLATIGSHIGDKDHATVLHACKTVNNLIETDKRFRLQLDEIEKTIKFLIKK